MKNKFYIILLFAAALFVSCEKSENITVTNSLDTITATIDGVETKTTIEGNKVLWEAGDEIMVFGPGGTKARYTLIGGAGTTTGEFDLAQGETNLTSIVAAVYPYTADAAYSPGDGITISTPSEYEYAENSLNKAPMAALGSNLNFKIAGALVEINVNNIPAGYTKLYIRCSDTENLNSESSLITFDPEGKPSLTIPTQANANSSYKTTVNFEASAVATDKTFYIPVPTGDFTGLQIQLGMPAGGTTLRGPFNRLFERGKRYYASYTLSAVSGLAPVTKALDDEITEALKSNPNVVLTDEDADNIVLPKASEMGSNIEGEPVSITINNKTGDAPITIKGTDDTDAPENVTIVVPDKTMPEMEINLPVSTVTLQTTGIGAFSTITATTAENTLIIPERVTVKHLIVKGGNVRISGKVGRIENQKTDKERVIIYKEYNAELPDNLSEEEFEIVTFENIATEAQLQNAFANGGNIALSANISLTSPLTLPAGKTLKLDLNGHILIQEKECTDSYNMITNKGSLTLTGKGTISFEDLSAGPENKATNTIRNEGTLTIDLDNTDGILQNLGPRQFSGTGTAICYPIDNFNGGKVIINNGTINAPQSRSLRNFYTNGEIEINGGTFKGQVWIQQGDAGTADTGTDKVCKVTINGGNFSPTGADNSSIFITNKQYDNVNLSVTDGTFNTKIGASHPDKEGVAGKITGGEFTDKAKSGTSQNLFATGSWTKTGEGFNKFTADAQ